jgi:biotin carboxyl carrier protein
MYQATVNGKKFQVEWDGKTSQGTLNDAPFQVDMQKISEGKSHWLMNNSSYNVEVVSVDAESKSVIIKVNGTPYTVELKDRYDDLMKSLGMEGGNKSKVSVLKAPMPSMVLDILVKEGDAIEKDTPLLILEAMKMENVIKSPTAGSIKKIVAVKGTAVEKNAVLIEFA